VLGCYVGFLFDMLDDHVALFGAGILDAQDHSFAFRARNFCSLNSLAPKGLGA
jgi:hypothetical protein